MTSRIRVGVLFGGQSVEHEISILSARNIVAALDRSRFEPVLVGIDKQGRWLTQSETALLESARDPRLVKINESAPPAPSLLPAAATTSDQRSGLPFDVVFPIVHGTKGEDGALQGLLELAGIPYVGAGVLGSAIGMDKDVMKRLLQQARIPVARFVTLHRHEFEANPQAAVRKAAALGFPLFTKPANLGSSVGIRKVKARKELQDALAYAFEFDLKVIAEEGINGREIECSVLGDEHPVASVAGEIIVRHKDGFYSYDAKYVDESGAQLEIPAKLDKRTLRRVQDLAVRTFKALECSGMARVDFFLTKRGRLLVNEINTLPGFTAISMYPKLWEASGLSQTELLTKLIEIALARHARRAALRSSAPGP